MTGRRINVELVKVLAKLAIDRSTDESDAAAALLLAGVQIAQAFEGDRKDVHDFVDRMFDGIEAAGKRAATKRCDA